MTCTAHAEAETQKKRKMRKMYKKKWRLLQTRDSEVQRGGLMNIYNVKCSKLSLFLFFFFLCRMNCLWKEGGAVIYTNPWISILRNLFLNANTEELRLICIIWILYNALTIHHSDLLYVCTKYILSWNIFLIEKKEKKISFVCWK